MKFDKFFIFLFLMVGFIPNFEASDRSATQALYLSILNLLTYFYLFLNKERRNNFLDSVQTNYYFLFIFLFFLWSLITSPFAINQTESLRVLTEFGPILVAILPIYYFLNTGINNKTSFIINLIPVFLFFEIAAIIIPYLIDLNQDAIISRSSRYAGVTGNINIAAFSIVLKLPFVWHHLFKSESTKLKRIMCMVIYTAGLFSIFSIHETRGAMLSVLLIIISTALFYVFKSLRLNNKIVFLVKRFSLLLLPLFLVLSLNYYQGVLTEKITVFNRLETLQTLQDGSSQERLRYYGQALSSIAENPILGVGIGNWCLESVKRDIDYISNYVVAYHVHNDFLEIFAETGILGFLFFFGPLFFAVFILIRKIIFQKFADSTDFHFFLLLSIVGYLLDSFLNFPFSRPIQLIHLVLCMVVLSTIIKLKPSSKLEQLNKALLKPIMGFIIILIPLNVFGTSKTFKSNKEQYILLGQFNSSQFIEPIENVLKYEDQFPSLSGTTIPLSTFKGIYLTKNSRYEEAIPYYKRGIKSNPFLPISEAYLGWNYYNLDKIDSALFYTRKAFNKLPRNGAHYTYYMAALSQIKDTMTISSTYKKMKKLVDEEYVENVYTIALAGVLGKTNSEEILSKANARLLESKDPNAIKGIYILNFGEENTNKGHKAHEQGLVHFENKQYDLAAQFFEVATKFNNLEAPYFENAGNAYMKLGDYSKSLYFLDYVLDKLNPNSAKANYLKALILLENKEKIQGCKLLLKANKNGHPNAMRVYLIYCK